MLVLTRKLGERIVIDENVVITIVEVRGGPMAREDEQVRLGLAGALDAGPAVVRIGAPQVGQIIVDGVGVDIDEALVGGSVSVDGRGSGHDVGQ